MQRTLFLATRMAEEAPFHEGDFKVLGDGRSAYLACKKSAKQRGLPWRLTCEQWVSLVQRPCTYCGHKAQPRNGIDRIENWKAYHKENVVPACTLCNAVKSSRSVEVFLAHCKQVVSWSMAEQPYGPCPILHYADLYDQ